MPKGTIPRWVLTNIQSSANAYTSGMIGRGADWKGPRRSRTPVGPYGHAYAADNVTWDTMEKYIEAPMNEKRRMAPTSYALHDVPFTPEDGDSVFLNGERWLPYPEWEQRLLDSGWTIDEANDQQETQDA